MEDGPSEDGALKAASLTEERLEGWALVRPMTSVFVAGGVLDSNLSAVPAGPLALHVCRT